MNNKTTKAATGVLGPGKNCGRPLLCYKCNMKLAQEFFEADKKDWAEIYRQNALSLKLGNKNENLPV